MKVFRSITDLPSFKNAVVTIGSFDGVHIGHQKLLNRAKYLAEEIGGEDIIVTFHPHPRSIIYPKDNTLRLLSTLDEKLRLFEQCKVSNVVIVPFTFEFSQMDPREYIERFLINGFNPAYLILGYDHKFGFNRQGDIQLLRQYEQEGKFRIIEIKQQEIDEITISSTKIRRAITEGNIKESTMYLGHYYNIMGKVVKGDSLGEKIGFPTANIQVSVKDKLIPNEGIYAVYVWIDDQRFGGMLYIGNRPTIGDKLQTTVEVNIFDFSGSLYNETLVVEFVDFIRSDKKFDSLEGLTNQLYMDKATAQSVLEKESPFEKSNVDCKIVILNYNGEEYLESYLSTILESSHHDFDIVVVDNASTDSSVDYINEWHPEVKVVELSQNYGYAGGYNKGLQQIDAKYFALVNSDVLVKEPWLDPILAYMDQHPEVVAMQPKILSIEDQASFEYAGAAGGMMDLLYYPFCRGRIFDTLEKDEGQYNDVKEVFWTSGAAMVVRADIFKKLGGFDQDYFAHQEEIDFCWRAKRAGYKCMVHGAVQVYHMGGGTLDYDNPRKTFLNFRNNLATIIKNDSKRFFLFVILIRLILDGVAGLQFLLKGRWRQTIAVLQAHFQVYLNIFNLIDKRLTNKKLIQKVKIGKMNWKGRENRFIILDYFIMGIKKYKDL
ncbi:MAG: bifunctional riboflavin kinase/FAD synthetase [Saprospiraceae bacterium]|nr:bifunctional riboflavin kinase/FAD synthetase [Saprospiraceae bacterium]